MTDEQQRIRGYLVAQAAKLTPEQIIGRVEAAMADLRAALAAVPAARIHDRPAPEDWSANEVLAHVVDAGRHFGGGILRILDGQPGGQARDRLERAVPRRTADEWWTTLAEDRAALFARVRAADPQAHLQASVEHPFFGPLNWREALLFMRLHDLDHAGQLQKIAAALGPGGA